MYYNLFIDDCQWIINLKIWRIILNELILSTTSQPIICGTDFLTAADPFIHADRILDFNVLLYIADGVFYLTEDEIDYEVNAGDLIFLKKGLRHYGKWTIPKGTKFFFVHFYLDEPTMKCSELWPDRSRIGENETIAYSAKLPKQLVGLKNSALEKKIFELIEFTLSEDPYKRLKYDSMFKLLLADILSFSLSEKKSETLSERICVWLNDHCDEPFSTVRLEQEFFLSYKRMASVFRSEQGQTMQQYHTACRMSRACYLLRSTLLPVKEVASCIGYKDPLYFSRCFQAYSGVSPRAYRQSARESY